MSTIQNPHEIPSPDNKHTARTIAAGEIRFGPLYYFLKIDAIDFGERVFGDSWLWRPDSKIFAIQEWLSTDSRKEPATALTAINMETETECEISKALGGFIAPIKYEGDNIIYTKSYPGKGRIAEFESPLLPPARWKPISPG